MDDVILHADGIGIRFRIYHEKIMTLKEAMVRFFKRKISYEDFWALRGISFGLKQGASLGIIGRNGSGKSTLLRICAGVYPPTEGALHRQGKISPLIELGAGFDPELTGVENIYLQGALMGFSRKEMNEKTPAIIEFSELGSFIDTPVKNYSSGMYLRLGFAIAIHVEPSILLTDEIVAVGDASFQGKCRDRIEAFRRDGVSIVLVSHSMEVVREMCERTILLERGRVVFEGPSDEAAKRYEALLAGEWIPDPASQG